ncbi:hypothetical protein ACJRO7_006697 [Eucalyptus globulus]|uniref:Uncharacterized protein n=1 Tax=Eucalyptus globulus TaxID=34317 RepID=A0ABD3IIQ4_EUCGL
MTKIKILHRYDILPPANSVPTTTLPLTFFDIPWLLFSPMQRLFFYDFPQSLESFTQTTLPLLVRSLSLCLRRFFPFASSLVLPLAPPQKPFILYSDSDSLSLTVADSAADFADLVSNEPYDATHDVCNRELHRDKLYGPFSKHYLLNGRSLRNRLRI